MVARPERYPQVAATPGANYAEPASGVQLGGWPYGNLFPSSDANWLFRQLTDWNRAHDAHRLASIDILAATVSRVSATALTIYTGIDATLEAEITSGGVYYGNGERIDLTLAPTVYAGGNALVFPATSVSYVVARPQPPSGGAANGSSCAELAVSAVTPVAGWATILQVTTDALQITSASSWGVSSFLEWGSVPPNFGSGVWGTSADFSDAISAPRAVFAGDPGGTDTLQIGALADATAVTIYGNGTGRGITLNHSDAGTGLRIEHSGTGGGATINKIGASGIGLSIAAGSSTGLLVTGGSASPAITATGGSGASASAIKATGGSGAPALDITAGAGQFAGDFTASATSGYAGRFTGGTLYALTAIGTNDGAGGLFTGAGLGLGVGVLGGTSAGAGGVQILARNSTGYPLYSQTHSTATNAVAGAWLEGRDQAAGAEITAANYYPLVLSPKIATPANPHLHMRPQTSYPTQWADGGLAFAQSAVGVQGHLVHGCAADGAMRGVHSSLGGLIHGVSLDNIASNSNGALGSYTTLCTIVLSGGNVPKQGGRTAIFRVTMRVRVSVSGTPGGCNVRIVDNTAGVAFCEFVNSGTGATNGWRLAAGSTGWDATISFDYPYTMPITSRSFTLGFQRQSADAFTVTAQGGMVISGLY